MEQEKLFKFKLFVPPKLNNAQVSAVKPQTHTRDGEFYQNFNKKTKDDYNLPFGMNNTSEHIDVTEPVSQKIKLVPEIDEENMETVNELYSRLYKEAEKIKRWKITVEYELKEKERKLQENRKIIEALRKAIQELQEKCLQEPLLNLKRRLLLQALHLRRPLKPPKRRTLRGAVHRGPRRVKPLPNSIILWTEMMSLREKCWPKKSKVWPEKLKERHGPESPPPAGSKSPSPSAVPSIRSPPVLEAVRQSLRRPPHFVLSGSESEGKIRDDVPAPIPGPSTLHRDHANLGTEAESSPLDPETEKILQDNLNLVYDSLSNQFLMRVDPKTLLFRPAPPQVQLQVPRAVSPSPLRRRSQSCRDYSRSRSRTPPRAREHHAQGQRSRRNRSRSQSPSLNNTTRHLCDLLKEKFMQSVEKSNK
ncbi:hypothetical protein JD844_018538 [Phrynosoma platyrhinos]|uniref:Uncharacterized protein n=1 Tax=Phrynosoma platyrhinos TaxID=52577 RepID=A0ABQ7SNP1_PHRPL|nr:hypothetical protein JD844_018538 [Phrynosoma platyrhinos]